MIKKIQEYVPLFPEERRIFELVELSDTINGFIVIIQTDDEIIEIRSKRKYPIAYKNTMEGDATITVGELFKQEKQSKVIYEVKNSRYIESILIESQGWSYRESDLRHFIIFVEDNVIEFIDYFEPEIIRKKR